MSKSTLKIAEWGWIALAVWFAVFEFLGWYLQDWTLSQQWWVWMNALPAWVAWVFFAGAVGIMVHLWWPMFRKKR